MAFKDIVTIRLRSGKGGNGHVSFRREKYVPNGGPDGGDGGNGGDVILQVDKGMNTLADYRFMRVYAAGDGEEGGKKNCHGKSGESIVLKVPYGTVVKEHNSGKVIVDMSGDNEQYTILCGGRGGLGNQHYATSTMQAPRYSKPGQPAKELTVDLELKVIADVGLIGYPSVGKSTLISRVSNARPKIADYPFTTLQPNLGMVDMGDGEGFCIADLPGIIEGASEGAGLGHQFLRHTERTRVLIHVVDAAAFEGRDPVEDVYTINEELRKFSETLAKKRQIIAANKIDALSDPTMLDRLKETFEPAGIPVYPISCVTGKGIPELLHAVTEILKTYGSQPVVYAPEYFPEAAEEGEDSGFTVSRADDGAFVVEGVMIEKMLGYTNIDSEKGFMFFQNFLKERGILDALTDAGIQEGDTVRMYELEFDYYQ